MPKRASKQSEADIYHMTIWGVVRILIFEDDADRTRFLDLLGETPS